MPIPVVVATRARRALFGLVFASGCKPVPQPPTSDGGTPANATTTDPTPPPSECPPQATGRFVLVVEDVFTITGRGTVVTGDVASGRIEVGDEVWIRAATPPLRVRVTGIEAFRKLLDTASMGDHVGLLLADVEPSAIRRGFAIEDVAVDPAPPPAPRFEVTLHCASASKIPAMKLVRELTGVSLAEAKTKVEQVPSSIVVFGTRAEAEAARDRFTEIGAAATITVQ